MTANEVEELNKEYEAQLKEDLEEFEKEKCVELKFGENEL